MIALAGVALAALDVACALRSAADQVSEQTIFPVVDIESLKNDTSTPVEELNQRISPTLHAVEVRSRTESLALSCKDTIRITVFNAERGLKWREQCALLKSNPLLSGTQVLLLNEMDNGMARTGNENTTANLAECLGMSYAYGVEFLELTEGQKSEQQHAAQLGLHSALGFHGNAILSTFQMENFEVLRLPGAETYWYKGGFDGERRLGGRMALFASIPVRSAGGVADGAVEVVSTHLDYFVGEAYNRLSMSAIASQLERRGARRALVGGDLGSPGRRSTAANLLVDSWGFSPAARTHPVHCNLCSGDWMMVRGMDQIAREPGRSPRAVSSEGLSDHNFLSMDLETACSGT